MKLGDQIFRMAKKASSLNPIAGKKADALKKTMTKTTTIKKTARGTIGTTISPKAKTVTKISRTAIDGKSTSSTYTPITDKTKLTKTIKTTTTTKAGQPTMSKETKSITKRFPKIGA